MTRQFPRIERFIYSHHLFGGLRQAVGVLLPALVLAGWLGHYNEGLTAAVGASCVAILDQPGGPRRYGVQGMAAAVLLGSLTVTVVGFAGIHPLLLWLVVPALCFAFSMFTVFGKQGGLLGFACLLIMTLTMRSRPEVAQTWVHVLYSLGGGIFYFTYSWLIHRASWHREEQQALSAALFATADYMRARAALYDPEVDLDAQYRKMVRAQLEMTEAHQAARDTVLRELPRGDSRSDRSRAALLNLFIDMVALLDTLVATHTDYVTLRRNFGDADSLLFPRDALHKLAANLEQVALNVARGRRTRLPHSLKPELRALEFDLRELHERGFAAKSPEVHALLSQVLRRLRRANELILRMADNTRRGTTTALVDGRLEDALDRFVTRRKWRLGMLTSNLRLDSPHFRYAVRVMIAGLAGMTLSIFIGQWIGQFVAPGWTIHDYWVLLTILVIMKPGFALTRQRNGWRLAGTLIGCALALLIFNRFESTYALLGMLVVAGVLWYALLQVHFMLAAAANTVFVLLAFHFTSPNQPFVIGERVIDTLLASGIALLCSHFVLPWWESNYMGSLAAALRRANHRFFRSGLHYADLSRRLRLDARAKGDGSTDAGLSEAQHEAELQWRVDRKNVHIAFSNFAGAFHRMMAEPVRRQRNVKSLNALMTQHHTFASHVSATVPLLAEMDRIPDTVRQALDEIDSDLAGRERSDATADASAATTPGDHATLTYPLRQMQAAAALINELTGAVDDAPSAQESSATRHGAGVSHIPPTTRQPGSAAENETGRG